MRNQAASDAGTFHDTTKYPLVDCRGGDEVIRFFLPHALGKSYMFVIVFGKLRTSAAERTPAVGSNDCQGP